LSIKVRHQVGRSGESVFQLQAIEGIGVTRDALGRNIELDSRPRAQPREVPTFPIPPASMSHRQPKRTEQVVFVEDVARRHDHRRDRVVHDLLLRRHCHAPTLAPPTQLPDQLSATPMKLIGSLSRRPIPAPMQCSDHARLSQAAT
jgi:hypothetical protein